MRFESRRVQNGKKRSLQFEKTYFLYYSFLAGALALHFKDDLWSLRRRSYDILNHSKWRRIWLIAHPGLHCSTTGFLCQNPSNLASPLVHIMF
jgi:hypothetical protein